MSYVNNLVDHTCHQDLSLKRSVAPQDVWIQRRGWGQFLPESCANYVQLTRLNIAAPVALVYFPHLFGVLHTAVASTRRYDPFDVLWACTLLLGGSLFYSNAAHAWDDLVDAPIDRLMERTHKRPIARGAISSRAALVFIALQAAGAASFLFFLPPATAITVVPAIFAAAYYPWAKRHTYFPQVVLGLCLSWGIMTGSASCGVKTPWREESTWYLLMACTIWTVIYDTIYAYQDIPDDIRLGLKSTAVLFGRHTKLALWCLLGTMALMLYLCGNAADFGPLYFVFSIGGAVASLGLMLYTVELADPKSCWRWFSMGFWATGASITMGLVSQY